MYFKYILSDQYFLPWKVEMIYHFLHPINWLSEHAMHSLPALHRHAISIQIVIGTNQNCVSEPPTKNCECEQYGNNNDKNSTTCHSGFILATKDATNTTTTEHHAKENDDLACAVTIVSQIELTGTNFSEEQLKKKSRQLILLFVIAPHRGSWRMCDITVIACTNKIVADSMVATVIGSSACDLGCRIECSGLVLSKNWILEGVVDSIILFRNWCAKHSSRNQAQQDKHNDDEILLHFRIFFRDKWILKERDLLWSFV
jgi:hypothetical protein